MNIIERNTGVVGGGRGIIFVNNKYYMLSDNPAKVCVSKDLKSWTEYQLNSKYIGPKNIAYGNGVFVITGGSGTSGKTYFYRSTDGINWIPIEINTGKSYSITSNSVKFVNNRFVALLGIHWYNSSTRVRTKTENWFYTSIDGVSWTKHQLIIESSEDLDEQDIEYSKGLYVRIGNHGSIYTSTNLDNWIRRKSNTTNNLLGIVYGKGQFVVVGYNGTILTSSDGINWTKQDFENDQNLVKVRYANGMYIGCGYNGVILQSIDGILWQTISEKTSGTRYGMAYNNIDNVMTITGYKYSQIGTIPIFILNLSRELTVDSGDDSTLFFFNKELNLLGIIDYFISLRWRRKYFEAGEFEIVLPVIDYVLNLIDTDVLIMRNNYTEAGIIETIEFSDNGDDEEVTISGRFLSSLLERRIIKKKINFNGNTIEGMNTIVDSMTPLAAQWETVQVSMSSRSIQFQATYKNVYEYLKKLSSYSNIGFRIVPNVDSKVYMFEVWQGKDRSVNQSENEQYTFSDDNFNIEQGSLTISKKTKVNYVLVGGQGEDTDRILVEIPTSEEYFDLYEVFNDQKSLSNDGLSTSAYKQQLYDAGESILCDGVFTFEVTATNIGDYKKKWDLGDIVNIKKEKWEQSTTQRIIEVEEVIEDGNKQIYPTFGSPIASTWEDD